MLSDLSFYIPQIPDVVVDGIYGQRTLESVLAAQRYFGLPTTGVVDAATWDEIYDQFSGIETVAFRNEENFPPIPGNGQTPPRNRYSRSTTLTQFPGNDLRMGNQDPVRQEVIR